MRDRLRIVHLNLAFNTGFTSPEILLDAYRTLTEWSTALQGAGADVRVVQRFSSDCLLTHGSVVYDFVLDGGAGTPGPWKRHPRVIAAVVRADPDVVHVNGLMFPGMLKALRAALPRVAIVVQDHSGMLPRRWPWPINAITKGFWQTAFAAADAFTFTAAALATRWHAAGLADNARVIAIPEASTTLQPIERIEATRATGIHASPVLLWVGRLDKNKDPLTVLAGLERALPQLPGARVWMIYGNAELEPAVRKRIAESAVLRDRIVLLGEVPHEDMARYYSAADIFLSGSRHEGSGYALLEAMACGVIPCVTDIPSFRTLAGPCGTRWPAGNAAACARAIEDVGRRDLDAERYRVKQHFTDNVGWRSIALRTLHAYTEIARARVGSLSR